jgi:hypothetical protein
MQGREQSVDELSGNLHRLFLATGDIVPDQLNGILQHTLFQSAWQVHGSTQRSEVKAVFVTRGPRAQCQQLTQIVRNSASPPD